MKKFLYWNAPERGIVFSLALLFFGTWSVWNIFFLCGGLSPVFMGLIACGFEGTSLAVKYYKFAAEQGDAESQCNLGVCYANGTGVKQNHAEGPLKHDPNVLVGGSVDEYKSKTER